MKEKLDVFIASKDGRYVQIPLTCILMEESVEKVWIITGDVQVVEGVDRMRKLYEQFGKELAVIYKNVGLIQAKVIPFTEFDKKYVMLLDDDLYFRPGNIDRMFQYLLKLDADAVVGTKLDLFVNYGDADINPANKPVDEPVRVKFLDSAASIYNVEKARKLMKMIEIAVDNDLGYGSDFMFFSQIARKGRVYHVPSEFWHIGGGSKDFLKYSDFASIMTALYSGVATEDDVKELFGKIYKLKF